MVWVPVFLTPVWLRSGLVTGRSEGRGAGKLEVFQAALGPNVEVKRFEHILKGARRCAYRIVEKHNEDRQLAMKL